MKVQSCHPLLHQEHLHPWGEFLIKLLQPRRNERKICNSKKPGHCQFEDVYSQLGIASMWLSRKLELDSSKLEQMQLIFLLPLEYDKNSYNNVPRFVERRLNENTVKMQKEDNGYIWVWKPQKPYSCKLHNVRQKRLGESHIDIKLITQMRLEIRSIIFLVVERHCEFPSSEYCISSHFRI